MAHFENKVICAKDFDSVGIKSSEDNIYDGCSSDEEDNILKSNLLQHKINRTTSTIEITKLRKIPTVLFYVFLLIFSLISLKYAAGFYRVNKYKIYRDKFSINYFSEAFAEQFVIIKIANVIAHFVLGFIILCLTLLIKQRISVPELRNQKFKIFLITFSSITSILSVFGMMFYYEDTLEFSRINLRIVDNVLFLIYLISSFTYCFMSNSILNLMDCKEVPKDKGYINAKSILLLVMGFQVFLFSVCLFLVSYYVPKISIEKNLFILIVSAMGVNSIIFILCMIFFIWTLKYDLYFVNLNLAILPDIEYFVDFEEDNDQKEKAEKEENV